MKKEEYKNLIFFIFRQHYQYINNEKIKIQLIKNIFENEILIKKGYIFLIETMKELKPKLDIEGNNEDNNLFIDNYLILNNNSNLIKYKNLYDFFNSLDSMEFNELLLYFFENQCQTYFSNILILYNNQYSKECCEILLLKTSFHYLKKSIQYLQGFTPF